jgi:predicted small lipoprotein YifL
MRTLILATLAVMLLPSLAAAGNSKGFGDYPPD